jgi:predicted GNAT family acetyltransferase
MSELEQLEVVDLGDEQRYELRLDGERVGSADYRVRNGVMTIPHVETEPAHQGKEFAARLMSGVLDNARTQELSVNPTCTYAAAYMRRRPETHDLVAS